MATYLIARVIAITMVLELPPDCSALSELIHADMYTASITMPTDVAPSSLIFVLTEFENVIEELNHIVMAKACCPRFHFISKSLLLFLDH